MQPLLYDFGQVTGKPEKDYITQIVTNHVSAIKYKFCTYVWYIYTSHNSVLMSKSLYVI